MGQDGVRVVDDASDPAVEDHLQDLVRELEPGVPEVFEDLGSLTNGRAEVGSMPVETPRRSRIGRSRERDPQVGDRLIGLKRVVKEGERGGGLPLVGEEFALSDVE